MATDIEPFYNLYIDTDNGKLTNATNTAYYTSLSLSAVETKYPLYWKSKSKLIINFLNFDLDATDYTWFFAVNDIFGVIRDTDTCTVIDSETVSLILEPETANPNDIDYLDIWYTDIDSINTIVTSFKISYQETVYN